MRRTNRFLLWTDEEERAKAERDQQCERNRRYGKGRWVKPPVGNENEDADDDNDHVEEREDNRVDLVNIAGVLHALGGKVDLKPYDREESQIAQADE